MVSKIFKLSLFLLLAGIPFAALAEEPAEAPLPAELLAVDIAANSTPVPETPVESTVTVEETGLVLLSDPFPVCNQGAYCRHDPSVCGPEGFCNPQTWCCMCY